MRNLIENVLRPILVAVGAVVLAHCGTVSCKPPGGAELEVVYNAELLECVRVSDTLQQSCECRKVVDTKWGLCSRPDWPSIGRCDYRCEDQK